MFSFFHGFGHGETWIILRTLGFGRFFLDLDLLVFVWIWTVSLDLDLVGFFSRFGFERFSVGSGLLVFFGSGSFLVFGWIGLVFLRKRIFRFSVGFGSQTVFSKSS